MEPKKNASHNQDIAKFAAVLSLTEIGIGSLLHGLKLPLSGQTLSLNQIFILNIADIKIKKPKASIHISTIVCLLKTLSPAGKKLTPMLAISMQGLLFYIGVQIFGNNIFGRLIGSVLSSLWAFIQPLILYLLIFGENLIFMANYFLKKLQAILPATPDNLFYLLLALVAIKIIIAITISFLSNFISISTVDRYQNWLKNFKKVKRNQSTDKSPYIMALKDTFNPIVIFTLTLSLIFFISTHKDISYTVWAILRPLAIGYLIFLFIRIYPVEKMLKHMKDGEYKEILKKTLSIIKDEK